MKQSTSLNVAFLQTAHLDQVSTQRGEYHRTHCERTVSTSSIQGGEGLPYAESRFIEASFGRLTESVCLVLDLHLDQTRLHLSAPPLVL